MLTLIKNATLVNEGEIYKADVLIKNQIIKKIASKITIDADTIIALGLEVFLAGIAGARIFFVLEYHEQFFSDDKSLLQSILAIINIPAAFPKCRYCSLLQFNQKFGADKYLSIL
jgi:dihydroorotase